MVTLLVCYSSLAVLHLVTQKCSCEYWPKGAKDYFVEAQKIQYSLVAKRLEKYPIFY